MYYGNEGWRLKVEASVICARMKTLVERDRIETLDGHSYNQDPIIRDEAIGFRVGGGGVGV